MATALDVAQYFLKLSQDEGDSISNLKLQKLCYYAQGFALAILGRPVFGDAIVAWEHGPVVVDLYQKFKQHGANGIPAPTDFDPSSALSDEERELLDEVWEVYGQFSAWKLRNMTHEESPWLDTPHKEVISHDRMRSFFATRVS